MDELSLAKSEVFTLKMRCVEYEQRLHQVGLQGQTGEQLQKSNAELYESNEKLEKQVQEYRAKAKGYARELKDTKSELAKSKKLVCAVKEGATRLASGNSSLLEKNEALKDALSELQKEVRKLETERDSLGGALKARSKDLIESKQECERLSASVESSNAKIVQIENELESERREKVRLKEEHAVFLANEEQMRSEANEANKAQNSALEKQRDSAEKVVKEREEQLCAAESELIQEQQNLARARQEKQQLEERLTALQRERDEAVQKKDSLEAAWNRSLKKRGSASKSAKPLGEATNRLGSNSNSASKKKPIKKALNAVPRKSLGTPSSTGRSTRKPSSGSGVAAKSRKENVAAAPTTKPFR